MVADDETAYLSIDRFIADLIGARALASAFEVGLVHRLVTGGPEHLDTLADAMALEPRGLGYLVDLLRASGVLVAATGTVDLSAEFRSVLGFRDLIEAKLEFAAAMTPDIVELLSPLLLNPPEFMRRSRVFDLFRYDRCLESTPENRRATERWMRLTTALTRYEAPVVIARHDFSGYRRMLDVGGNSGEFALQICRAHPRIAAIVFDLPSSARLARPIWPPRRRRGGSTSSQAMRVATRCRKDAIW